MFIKNISLSDVGYILLGALLCVLTGSILKVVYLVAFGIMVYLLLDFMVLSKIKTIV